MNKSIVAAISMSIALIGCGVQPVYQCNSSAQETTPTSRFGVNRIDGIAFDKKTNLTWKICSEGQRSSNGHCTGDATWFTWDSAMQKFGDKGEGWRLPSVDELKSIVEGQCQTPAINIAVFHNTPSSSFWSASLDDTNPLKAWYVSFLSGNAYPKDKTVRHNVRLVQGVDAEISEEQQELVLGLIEQNRIDDLLVQESKVKQDAYVSCNNKVGAEVD